MKKHSHVFLLKKINIFLLGLHAGLLSSKRNLEPFHPSHQNVKDNHFNFLDPDPVPRSESGSAALAYGTYHPLAALSAVEDVSAVICVENKGGGGAGASRTNNLKLYSISNNFKLVLHILRRLEVHCCLSYLQRCTSGVPTGCQADNRTGNLAIGRCANPLATPTPNLLSATPHPHPGHNHKYAAPTAMPHTRKLAASHPLISKWCSQFQLFPFKLSFKEGYPKKNILM